MTLLSAELTIQVEYNGKDNRGGSRGYTCNLRNLHPHTRTDNVMSIVDPLFGGINASSIE